MQYLLFGFMGISTTSVLARTIMPPLYYLALLFIVYIIKKVPLIRKIVP